jgi:hypothetical protein
MPDPIPSIPPESSDAPIAVSTDTVPAVSKQEQPMPRWMEIGLSLMFPILFFGLFVGSIVWSIWQMPPEKVHNETTGWLRARYPNLMDYYTQIDQCANKTPDPLRLQQCRHQILMAMTDERQIAAAMAYETALDVAEKEGKVYRSHSMED